MRARKRCLKLFNSEHCFGSRTHIMSFGVTFETGSLAIASCTSVSTSPSPRAAAKRAVMTGME